MRAFVVGIMGAGDKAVARDLRGATQLGRAVAERGWVTLCGGRDTGVMRAVSEAARSAGGLTVGLLPGNDRRHVAPGILLALPTGLGNARNAVNVLAADAVVALAARPGAGTLSEMALALKSNRRLIVWTDDVAKWAFLERLDEEKPLVTDEMEKVVRGLEDMADHLSRKGSLQPIHLDSTGAD